jgi:hypothetical protein
VGQQKQRRVILTVEDQAAIGTNWPARSPVLADS